MKNYLKLIGLLLVLIGSVGVYSVAAQNEKAAWTLMFYMDSDNNLEAAQMDDLDEMIAVGSTANVNIVVLADRSAKGDDEDGYTSRPVGGIKNWTTAKLMVVEKGKLRELADWGEVNMGNPANLKRFMETITTQFPSERYGIVFGDHGAGWVGIVSDESAHGDSLDTNELPAAFKDIATKNGKLEFIGFDACLMANFEAAKSIAPYGKAMVASEELEPGDGWNYTPLITSLNQNPQMDGIALGKRVVDTYRDYYLGADAGNRDKTVTLAVIDLAKIPAVETAVSNLGIRNLAFMKSGGRNTWIQTAQARSRTEEFGVQGEDRSHYYDIVHYAENIKTARADAATGKAADDVITATKAAVVYKIAGAAHARSSGMSIYFPPDIKGTDAAYTKTPFSVSGKWMPFLAEFMGVKTADTAAPEIQQPKSTSNTLAEGASMTITAQLKALDDLDEATFVLAETDKDGQIIIGAIPTEPDEKGLLSEEWDGSWFSIGDGKKELICPISNFEDAGDGEDTYLAEVPAQVRFKGTNQWRDVTLYFYLDFNEEEVVGEFIYAFEFVNDRAREVDIDAGDSLRPVYLAIDKNGNMTLEAPQDAASILNVTKDDNITVGRIGVAAGDYLVGFVATDLAGNDSEEFVEVTVK